MILYDTPWALGDEGYYKIEQGRLLFAPINNIDYSVDTQQEMEVEIVTPFQLQEINQILGTCYTIDEINAL
ncbi:MAG: hypothetical protein U9Q30_00545 [Campylobacterota bacterium]|nr:hypothetical protein [Campylobacterota bacterium]